MVSDSYCSLSTSGPRRHPSEYWEKNESERPSSCSCCFFSFHFMVELKWFLMWLSVLPGRNLAISAHLLPKSLWAFIMISSSLSVHFPLLMSGFKWLCHLSLHCLPILPGKWLEMTLQFLGPYFLTIRITFMSSSGVHGPLTSSGFNTFCHLWRHCTSVRSVKNEAILFQFLASNFFTSPLSFSS